MYDSLLRCNDCRWAKMIHCSDPEHCGGMKLPTWEETLDDLKKINEAFISLHKRPEKDWETHEKDLAKRLRAKCVKLQEYRYSLLRKKNG